MRVSAAAALILACLFVSACAGEPARVAARSGSDIALVPDTATVIDRVPRHATFATLLRDVQLRPDLIPAIIETTRAVFDPRELRAGHNYQIIRTTDGLLRELRYEIDLDRFLHLAAPPGEEETSVTARIVAYRKELVHLAVGGEITREAPSLFAAMDEAGETADLSLALADIFGGEVDFNSDIQPGDTFGVAVDRVLREGEPVGYGPIVAAEFVNEGRRLRAVLFTPPGGKPGYYDEHGRSLRRFFLKSPLKFILAPHVTSRFSRSRFHPVLRISRPHLGVDYRAPIGAPVVSVANGVVVSAGWGGQGGRTVRIRHSAGYETFYMHLSAIARGVRAGARVSQGQVIGNVGMSGLATGPHLDYRVKKNGAPLDPLRVHRSLPPGEPIPAAAMDAFGMERDAALARLAAKPAAPVPGPDSRRPAVEKAGTSGLTQVFPPK